MIVCCQPMPVRRAAFQEGARGGGGAPSARAGPTAAAAARGGAPSKAAPSKEAVAAEASKAPYVPKPRPLLPRAGVRLKHPSVWLEPTPLQPLQQPYAQYLEKRTAYLKACEKAEAAEPEASPSGKDGGT